MAKIDKLLTRMVKSQASDLHLSAGEPVRLRVHGELESVGERSLADENLHLILREICRPEQWSRFEASQELEFSYGLEGVGRFRCAYLRHHHGLGAVFRVIPEEIIPLEHLGLPRIVSQFPDLTSGLVLVTGPAGSGKSTTLAAIVDRINAREARHIITVEDPIEFVHSNQQSFVVQREVGADTPSFPRAVRDALREDPDVLMVSELGDPETIALALAAAEMGVLVLASRNTTSAARTIQGLVEAFPAEQQAPLRSLLADSLVAMCSQQLIRRHDGTGRVPACEILMSGPELPVLIREGTPSQVVYFIRANQEMGMQTIDDALMALVSSATVTAEVAYQKATDKQKFEEWLEVEGIPFAP